METKDFKFTLDDIDEERGTFTGFASVFGEVDSYNEVVTKGAFRKTLKENDGKFPLCWFHDVSEPLGIALAKEKKQGLVIEGYLNLDVQSAREKRSLMIQGAIKGLSIGFRTIKDEWDDEVRYLKEIQLYEISPITLNFQACPGAEIGEVKAVDYRIKTILEQICSIENVANLTKEDAALIDKAKTTLEALLEDYEPLRIGDIEPIDDTLDPQKSQKDKEPSKAIAHSMSGLLEELRKLNTSLGGNV